MQKDEQIYANKRHPQNEDETRTMNVEADTHAEPVCVTFLYELRSAHWNILPRGEIQEKKMLPVKAANSQTSY